MPTVQRGNLEIGYRVSGDGPPLVLNAGVGFGSWMWYLQYPALDQHFTVIAPDNRSVGESSKTTEPYTIHDVADDVVAILDRLEVTDAHIAGASFGGFVSQSIAARYPQRTRTLTLIVAHHGGPEALPVPSATAAAMLDPGEGLTFEQRLRKLVPLSFSPGFAERQPEVYEDFFARRLANVMAWDEFVVQATAGATADLSDYIDAITAPVQILAAAKDRVVPVGNAALLAKRLPGSRVAVHPDSGHIVMVEDPDWLNNAIIEFCLEHERVTR